MRRTAVVAGLSGIALVVGGSSLAAGAAPPVAAAKAKTDRVERSAMGAGLGALVQKQAPSTLRKSTTSASSRFAPEDLAIRDKQGRVLVDVTPRANVDAAAFRKQVEALGMTVTAVEPRHGTLE